MRNLVEYPLTKGEIIKTLQEMADAEGKSESIGGIRAVALDRAASIVEAAYGMRDGLDRRYEMPRGDHMRWVTPWGEAAKLYDAISGKS